MHLRALLSLTNFFCALHFFLVLYVIAPYLATFIPDATVGLVIAGGSVLTLASFPFVPRAVRTFGTRRIFLVLIVFLIVALLLLAARPTALGAITLIALFCAVQPVIAYLLDLMLEATITTESNTGRIRTAFITCANLALVLAPLLTGLLLGSTSEYLRIFLVSAVALVPAFILLCCVRIPEQYAPSYATMREVYRCLVNDPDVFAAGIANATLQFFYHLAPFFIPLYLHSVLGFPWSELGWMFAVALIPFVLIEYPVGWIADRITGDQEFMALGFLITGTAFASLAFVTTATPSLSILIALITTRIGAAMTEATAESHFFRRVSQQDVNSVGIFRMLRPFGALTAPIIGSLFLLFTTYNVFFFVTGIAIIIVGVGSALSIKDVR